MKILLGQAITFFILGLIEGALVMMNVYDKRKLKELQK